MRHSQRYKNLVLWGAEMQTNVQMTSISGDVSVDFREELLRNLRICYLKIVSQHLYEIVDKMSAYSQVVMCG